MSKRGDASLSRIPSMTALLAAAEKDARFATAARGVLTDALREATARLREGMRGAEEGGNGAGVDGVLSVAAELLKNRQAARLTKVINATGIVLHTGLGRSVLAAGAIERLTQVASGYCNLEIDLTSGQRGRRGEYAEHLLCQLTSAAAAMIVNNNAAATMLALRGLAAGREVIVSRGQLIEIGGSFRLPEVMAAGGAVLREVGTTNKTHLGDYEAAIGERTAMIMHVHTSNYRVVGFAESPGVDELAALAHRHGLVMFDDLGSGALLDEAMWRAAEEPTVTASLRAGADFLAFSGDKLLGGPQAGILLGNKETIERLRKDPMARALRVDKLTLAGLEATLELYQNPLRARAEIPTLIALTEPIAKLTNRAEKLAVVLRAAVPDATFVVDRDESFAGGGSLPAWPMPTAVVRWKVSGPLSVDEICRRLRMGRPAVLTRIHEGDILFDMRTILPLDYEQLAAHAAKALLGPCG